MKALAVLGLSLLCVSLASPVPALAVELDQSPYAHDAKIDLLAARTIALRQHAGTITAQELEKESGGSGLRYSFDILTRHGAFEVGVDAISGSVLENGPLTDTAA
ncbi:PepSY domain-containing protein [Novosphingobium sp.]|jgi:uncharacterized membrane protein YkoI|uniref:PepSY domain-containing protein n=1 Tax=Novosphingobium sp. TaxID=1874826 RepID=UPI002FDF205D